MDCLFCFNPDPTYKLGTGIDFICCLCVQMLLGADQRDLKVAHSKAVEKGFANKAKAIKSFLIPEELNVRETEKLKRGAIRKKPMRVVRPSRNQLWPQPTTV